MASNSKDGEIDTSAAEAFEKYLVPTIFGPWSETMIDHAGDKGKSPHSRCRLW